VLVFKNRVGFQNRVFPFFRFSVPKTGVGFFQKKITVGRFYFGAKGTRHIKKS